MRWTIAAASRRDRRRPVRVIKEGRGVILACLQPVFEYLPRFPMHWHEIPDSTAFNLHSCKALGGVLVPVQS